MNRLFACLFAGLLAACSTPSVVNQPTTAKAQPLSVAQISNGSIFQSGTAKLLFEEPIGRYVGDTLLVTIEENLSTSNKANTSTSRTGSLSTSGSGASGIPHLPGVLEKLFNLSLEAANSSKFDGKGETGNTNTFKGSLAVTVIEVLPNGNLSVGGEKRVNINGQINNLRLTGVISPRDVKAGNTISSTRIADARIEQVGEGAIADAGTMGWLSRFFQSVSPL